MTGARTIRTFDQSASSSSATITGSAVKDPSPISTAGDMIAIVPSVEIVTQGLRILSLAVAPSAARCGAPTAKPKVRPAAPTMKPRRFSAGRTRPSMSHLLRRALDGADDAGIGAAAAEIGAHMLDDLSARRMRILLQERRCAHDLAG